MSLILTRKGYFFSFFFFLRKKGERERERNKKYIWEVGRKVILALEQDKRSK